MVFFICYYFHLFYFERVNKFQYILLHTLTKNKGKIQWEEYAFDLPNFICKLRFFTIDYDTSLLWSIFLICNQLNRKKTNIHREEERSKDLDYLNEVIFRLHFWWIEISHLLVLRVRVNHLLHWEGMLWSLHCAVMFFLDWLKWTVYL